MTVESLIKCLSDLDQSMEVFIGEPMSNDAQENHEQFGLRYLVHDNKRVWFETYGEEDIEREIDAMIEACIDSAYSDEDFVDMVFSKYEHGYTLEDIEKNCSPDIYYWLKNNEYRKEMYPDA